MTMVVNYGLQDIENLELVEARDVQRFIKIERPHGRTNVNMRSDNKFLRRFRTHGNFIAKHIYFIAKHYKIPSDALIS